MTISWNRGCGILAHIRPFFIGLYERNYFIYSSLNGVIYSHFFTRDSIAIDFGIDYSSDSSSALRSFHLIEDTKLFNRFTSQRLLPTHVQNTL